MKEKIPGTKTTEEQIMKPEDVIVAEMRGHIADIKNDNHKENGTERFHSEIENSYSATLFEEYEAGKIPNLAMLELGALRAAETIQSEIAELKEQGISDEDLVEEVRLEKLLRGRPQIIAANIKSYIAAVLQFQQLAKMHAIGRDVTKQFEQVDHRRRRIHNALLDTLRTFTSTIEEAKVLDLLADVSVIKWQPGIETSEDSIVVFSERTLEDRDYIRDWAIVAEMHERLREIKELEK